MRISVCVVAYNEEKTIQVLLDCIRRQDYAHDKIEIILIDSNSTDKTKEIMSAFDKGDFYDVKVFDNPGRVLPAGCNIALRNYTGDAIVRIDAHARIPQNFISENVAALMEGHDIVGGVRFSSISENTRMQNTLLMAEESKFGSGIAPYRGSNINGYVKALFHPCYTRAVFNKVGEFDEELVRTEDNEMNYRIRKAGFKFYCSSSISSEQLIRNSFKEMLQQKYSNGFWIGRTLKKCPKCLSLYHIVPAMFVLGLFVVLISVLLAVGGNVTAGCIAVPGLVVIGLYVFLSLIMSVKAVAESKTKRNITNILLPVIFPVMHICYGIGTISGIISSAFSKIKN